MCWFALADARGGCSLLLGLSLVASGPGALFGEVTRLLQGMAPGTGPARASTMGRAHGAPRMGTRSAGARGSTCGYPASEVSQPSPFPLLSCMPLRAQREPPARVLGSTA